MRKPSRTPRAGPSSWRKRGGLPAAPPHTAAAPVLTSRAAFTLLLCICLCRTIHDAAFNVATASNPTLPSRDAALPLLWHVIAACRLAASCKVCKGSKEGRVVLG